MMEAFFVPHFVAGASPSNPPFLLLECHDKMAKGARDWTYTMPIHPVTSVRPQILDVDPKFHVLPPWEALELGYPRRSMNLRISVSSQAREKAHALSTHWLLEKAVNPGTTRRLTRRKCLFSWGFQRRTDTCLGPVAKSMRLCAFPDFGCKTPGQPRGFKTLSPEIPPKNYKITPRAPKFPKNAQNTEKMYYSWFFW